MNRAFCAVAYIRRSIGAVALSSDSCATVRLVDVFLTRGSEVVMLRKHAPKQNLLLAALPAEEYERLLPHLELAPLELGWVVYESGSQLQYVYFPTDCIISLLYVMENGASAEIAVVGNEGLVGIALFMGGETTPSRAVVQSAGYAYRLRAGVLKREFERGGALQQLLLRYASTSTLADCVSSPQFMRLWTCHA